MRSFGNTILVLTMTVLGSSAAMAVPTIAVNPTSIATDHVGTVQIDVGNLSGPQTILRLYVDANGNGSIDAPADTVVWTDVVADNVPDWSPNMFSDSDGTTGAVTVDARLFAPLIYPYSAGTLIWQAEDTFDGSTQTATFSVTQAVETQSVSGTVRDSGTTLGVAGALVLLFPWCEEGDETNRLYTAFTDNAGSYTIQVPADVECRNRVVVAAKPGYLTSFVDQPSLNFNGTSQFTSQDPEITPGTHAASGRIEYATGPLAGSGIPGVLVTAGLADGDPLFSVAFTDENGDYTFLLADGDWSVEAPEDGIETRGAVFLEDSVNVNVAGGPAAVPLLTLPAANAFFEGTLRDELNAPVPGQWVSADRSGFCDPDCYGSLILTRADGTYSIGVVAPDSPSTYEYTLSVDSPLVGLVGEQRACEFISSGDTLTGRDVHHFAPTGFISGTVTDKYGQPVQGQCLEAQAFPSCTAYTSTAVTGCDGSYSLPVLDGMWGVQTYVEDFAALYGGFAPGGINRQVDIAGTDATDVNFILGPWHFNPHINQLHPADVVAGSHLVVLGYGFSEGTDPKVFIDAAPATVVGFRPDIGAIVAEIPPATTAGSVNVTAVNMDTGATSDPACLEVAAGPYTPVCTISGTVTDGGGAVAGAAVIAELNDEFARAAVTDGSGNYSIGLDAFGSYSLDILPPTGLPYLSGSYVVACDTTQDHLFATGWQLTGQVVDEGFEGVADVPVDANEVGGSGYATDTKTDADGFFSLFVPSGTFDVQFGAPADSRSMPPAGFQQVIAGNTDVGQITANTGQLFCGTVVDEDGNGVAAEVGVFLRAGGTPVTDAISDSCTGQFDVAVLPDEYGMSLDVASAAPLQSSLVRWVETDGDQVAEFDFVMFDETSAPPATSVPQILFASPELRGQQGQPMQLTSADVGGASVEVLFSDGVGGFVAGDSTFADASRGLVLTRIPAGAASGEMKLRVDGADSDTLPFTLLPGIFSSGGLTVSGTVSGTGAAGTLVGLAWVDTTGGCGDDDGVIVDYGIADGAGNYGPLSHPGGEIQLAFAPPAGTMLAATSELRSGVASNLTVDVTLVTGVAVTVRATDDLAIPLEDVIFWTEDDVTGSEDETLTDSGGNATLYVTPGTRFFGLVPPAGSRLVELETEQTIVGPFGFGDRALTRGTMVSSSARQSDGTPVAGALVESQRSTDPFDFFFETFSAADGAFRGPVPSGSMFQLWGEVFDDTLTDFGFSETADAVSDNIFYPAFESGPAGFISGVVSDADTLLPIGDIFVAAFEPDPMDPGNPGAFETGTSTCPDGTYELKIAAGDHYLQFSDFQPGLYAGEWFPDAPCFVGASPVTVTEGFSTNADIALSQTGSISGIVLDQGVPHAGATVCASSTLLGGCLYCAPPTDGSGLYTLQLSPATDYEVSAFSPTAGTQCYDGFQGCPSFTPVAVVAATGTPDVDFDYCSLLDDDFDSFSQCDGDCDDLDPSAFPGASEICDGVDNDCDSVVDEPTLGVLPDGTLWAVTCTRFENKPGVVPSAAKPGRAGRAKAQRPGRGK